MLLPDLHIGFSRGRPGGLVFPSLSVFSPILCGHSTGKGPIPRKDNAKESSNYCTIVLFSHASKVMLKIFQAWMQQYVNRELPDVQVRFRKGRRTRDQIASIHWIIKKAREFQKKSALLTMPKPFTVWITTVCGKFFKRWEYQTT